MIYYKNALDKYFTTKIYWKWLSCYKNVLKWFYYKEALDNKISINSIVNDFTNEFAKKYNGNGFYFKMHWKRILQ